MVRPVSLIQKLVAEHLPCTRRCNKSQAGLPDAMKANTQEAGADEKESGLFADAGHLEDGCHVSKPIPWKMGDSCHKAHLYLSVKADVFIRRKRTEQKDQGRGLKSSPRADEHSPF